MELRRDSDFVQHMMTMAYPSGYATYHNSVMWNFNKN